MTVEVLSLMMTLSPLLLSLVDTSKVTKLPAVMVPVRDFIDEELSKRDHPVRSISEFVGLYSSTQSLPDEGCGMNSFITTDEALIGEENIKNVSNIPTAQYIGFCVAGLCFLRGSYHQAPLLKRG
jgi:hypothetical protein